MIAKDETANFDIFRDCLSTTIIQKLAPDAGGKGSTKRRVKGRKNEIKPVARVVKNEEANDAAELGDFVEVTMSLFRHLYRCANEGMFSISQKKSSSAYHPI